MTEEEKKAQLLKEIGEAETTLTGKKADIEKQQKELDAKKAETTDYETRKSGLDSELQRVLTDIASKKEERRKLEVKESSFQDKLKSENLDTAKARFFTELGIKSEAQDKLFEGFTTEAVTPELILKDMRKFYAANHAEELLETHKKVQVLSEQSDEFKAQMSSSGFNGNGFEVRGNDEGMTAEDIQAAQWAGMPVERYKKLKAEGKLG